MKTPEILSFSSGTDYLKKYYAFRKAKNKKFSYESWAREISYPHRSNLRLVVSGSRKISPLLEACVSKKMLLSTQERAYLKVLCQIERLKTGDDKCVLDQKAKLLKTRRQQNFTKSEGNRSQILDLIYLHTLLGFQDVKKTSDNLSRLCKKSKTEVERDLTALQAVNALESKLNDEAEIEWSAKSQYSIFQDDFKNKKLAEFHKSSFLKAVQSQELDKEKRRFDSLILALGPAEYAKFTKELQDFLDVLFYKYNTSELKDKTLYQVQIGTFPAL